jgi:hypothetical protein
MFHCQLCNKTGMCLTQGAVMMYMESRPLPSLLDFGYGGFLCISTSSSSSLPEQPVQYVMAVTVQTITLYFI